MTYHSLFNLIRQRQGRAVSRIWHSDEFPLAYEGSVGALLQELEQAIDKPRTRLEDLYVRALHPRGLYGL